MSKQKHKENTFLPVFFYNYEHIYDYVDVNKIILWFQTYIEG